MHFHVHSSGTRVLDRQSAPMGEIRVYSSVGLWMGFERRSIAGAHLPHGPLADERARPTPLGYGGWVCMVENLREK